MCRPMRRGNRHSAGMIEPRSKCTGQVLVSASAIVGVSRVFLQCAGLVPS